jgi:hypothetical protein
LSSQSNHPFDNVGNNTNPVISKTRVRLIRGLDFNNSTMNFDRSKISTIKHFGLCQFGNR